MARSRGLTYNYQFARNSGDNGQSPVVVNKFRAKFENFGNTAQPLVYEGDPEFTITIMGFIQVRLSTPPQAQSQDKTLTLSLTFNLSGPPSEATWASFNDSDTLNHTLLSGDLWEFDFDGADITVTATVEESDASTSTGLFPNFGGTQVAFGPKMNRLVRQEELKVGTNLVVSATVGSLSVSATVPITAAKKRVVDYSIARDLSCETWPFNVGLRGFPTLTLDTTEVALGSSFSLNRDGYTVSFSPDTGTAEDFVYAPYTETTISGAHRSSGEAASFPRRCWQFVPYVQAGDAAYPDSLTAKIDRHRTDLSHTVVFTPDGTVADQYEQQKHSGSGILQNAVFTADQPGSAPHTRTWTTFDNGGYSTNEWHPFRASLWPTRLTELGEDPLEWHFPVLETAYNTGTLLHDSTETVLDGSEAWTNDANVTCSNAAGRAVFAVAGGTGQAHLTFATTGQEISSKYDMQAFRRLQVVIQANAASKPFTLRDSVSGKSWSGTTHATANTDQTFTFDLCVPHNAASATDSSQSRYPVTGVPGDYFGLTFVTTLYLEGLENGVTYSLDSVTGARDDTALLFCGLPQGPWLDNGAGSDYLIHLTGVSKKKAIEIPGQTRTLVADEYVYSSPAITTLYDALNARPGLTATLAGSFPDTLHNETRESYFVGGLFGIIWDGSAFTDYQERDITSALTLYAQPAYYEVDWFPYCGDLHSGTFQKFTPMRCAKVLQERVGAVVADTQNNVPFTGETVLVTGGVTPNESLTTDADGAVLSEGRKTGTLYVTHATDVVSPPNFSRYIAWAGFGDTPVTPSTIRLAAQLRTNTLVVVWTQVPEGESYGDIWESVHTSPVQSAGVSMLGWQELSPGETKIQITDTQSITARPGLVILPNRTLYLDYADEFEGGPVYRTAINIAPALADWSAVQNPDPQMAPSHDGDYTRGEGLRVRIFAGNVIPGVNRDGRGAVWDEVTAATGARGDTAGFCWNGQQYVLMYVRDSDGAIMVERTNDPAVWTGATSTGLTGDHILGMVTLANRVTVAANWDETSGLCRALRSTDGGATWEMDTSDIPTIPVLDFPPVIVGEGAHALIVWVEVGLEHPSFVVSRDGGENWV